AVARDAGLLLYAVEGERWRARGGRLTRLEDFWKRLHTVMRHLDAEQADRSFAEFLDDAPGGRHAADARVLARAFAEGLHAADPRRRAQRPDNGGGGACGRPVPRALVGGSPAGCAARRLIGVDGFSPGGCGRRAGLVVAISDAGAGAHRLGGRTSRAATGGTILERNTGARPGGSRSKSWCHAPARRCPGRGRV